MKQKYNSEEEPNKKKIKQLEDVAAKNRSILNNYEQEISSLKLLPNRIFELQKEQELLNRDKIERGREIDSLKNNLKNAKVEADQLRK